MSRFKFTMREKVLQPNGEIGIVISQSHNLAATRRPTVPIYETVQDGLRASAAAEMFAVHAENGVFQGFQAAPDGEELIAEPSEDAGALGPVEFFAAENTYTVATEHDGGAFSEREWAESALEPGT